MGKKKGITAKDVAEIIELKLTGKNEEQKANEIMDFLEPPDKGGKMKNEDYDKLSDEVKAWHVKAVADSVKRAETVKEKAKGKGVTVKKEAAPKVKKKTSVAVKGNNGSPFKEGSKYDFVYQALCKKAHTVDQLSKVLTKKFGENTGKKGNVSIYVRTISAKTGKVTGDKDKGFSVKMKK